MILAFDTSGSHLAIALADMHGQVRGEFHAEATTMERGIHDARLAIEVSKLLQEANVQARDIKRIGLIIGPGSFTGLRIGLSFAKGFAFATGCAIVPLTQHEVIAAEKAEDALIVTAGYRDNLFYVAPPTAPREIRLVDRSDLPSSFDLHPLSIKALVKLTVHSLALLHGQEIETLEPLYITEFQPS
jgi:tRNA threonylcarbamoyl adenosine modification protein YeaZ